VATATHRRLRPTAALGDDVRFPHRGTKGMAAEKARGIWRKLNPRASGERVDASLCRARLEGAEAPISCGREPGVTV